MSIIKALKSILEHVLSRSVPAFAKSPLSAPTPYGAAPSGPPIAPRRSDAPPLDGGAHAEAPPFDRARLRSAVLAMFNPSQPVENRIQLLGRRAELTQLLRVMMDLRTHAFVYGPRGAGKTSLMRAFGDYADERGHLVIYHSCGGGCGFPELFTPYLAELASAGLPQREQEELRHLLRHSPEGFGARALAGALAGIADRDVILVVDEYDRVEDPATRGEIATLLKLLSDFRSRVQLLFVGIARDVGELIEAHPSLRRHLVAIPLRPFDEAGIDDLFRRGAQATSLQFEDEARDLIAATAAGSPYHLRLFCFCAAMAAIDKGSISVDRASTIAGLEYALDLWSSTNPTDAALFGRLAASGEAARHDLESFVRGRLAADRLPPGEGGPAAEAIDLASLALLAPALGDDRGPGTHIFEDSLAPQFLLAACALVNERCEGAPEAVSRPLARRII